MEKGNLKLKAKKILRYGNKAKTEMVLSKLDAYAERLQLFFELIPENDRELLVEIIAYRLLGFEKVKLSRNDAEYQAALTSAKKLSQENLQYDPGFLHFKLKKFDLSSIGYDLSLYFSEAGIAIDFILEQYACKTGNSVLVSAKEGDVVFDLGGCWGDTALYFASKVKEKGRVYSFEFIPGNIKLFNINIGFNPSMQKLIKLIPSPVGAVNNEVVYYRDFGPGSQVKTYPFARQTGSTSTVTIDRVVSDQHIQTVDFIKMDIEGAELPALKGGERTLRKFKPDLAIAIYHSLDDIVNIPLWLESLKLGYKFHLRHFTIHAEETILFATTKI